MSLRIFIRSRGEARKPDVRIQSKTILCAPTLLSTCGQSSYRNAANRFELPEKNTSCYLYHASPYLLMTTNHSL